MVVRIHRRSFLRSLVAKGAFLEMPVKHLSRSLSHEEERAVSPAGMSLFHVSSAAEALRSRGYRRTHSCAIQHEPHSAAAAQSVPRRGCVESSRIDRKNSIYYFLFILYSLLFSRHIAAYCRIGAKAESARETQPRFSTALPVVLRRGGFYIRPGRLREFETGRIWNPPLWMNRGGQCEIRHLKNK